MLPTTPQGAAWHAYLTTDTRPQDGKPQAWECSRYAMRIMLAVAGWLG